MIRVRPFWSVVILIAGAWLSAPTHALAQETLVLTAQGRTLSARNAVPNGQQVVIRVEKHPDVRICDKKRTADTEAGPQVIPPGEPRIRYLVVSDVTQPRILTNSEVGMKPVAVENGLARIQAPPHDSFLIFNLALDAANLDAANLDAEKRAAAKLTEEDKAKAKQTEDALKDCTDRATTVRTAVSQLEGQVDEAERKIAILEARIPVLRQRLESQRTDAGAFGGRSGSASHIADILKEVAKTRDLLIADESALLDAKEARESASNELKETLESTGELGVALPDLEYALKLLRDGAVLKVGGIGVGKHKAVYYDMAGRASTTTLQMMPMGDYPPVRHGEVVSAVIANVLPSAHPYGFQLRVTSHDAAAVNTDPVRPTFDTTGGGESALALGVKAGKAPPTSARAYWDVFLAVRGAFTPNQYAEVTITTERPTDADPKKREPVTLVDKARYPQYRALYRYNFNTGIVGSRLRNQVFTKVRTEDDDPATEDVDESRFRIDERTTDEQVKPVFAFTYYAKPVDIQGPVSWAERFIPNPTIGFAITDPADDIFLGFSHELLRNAQLFWGMHWGQIDERVDRNDVSEERDAAAPVTRKRRDTAFTVGLTFNVAVITKIFK